MELREVFTEFRLFNQPQGSSSSARDADVVPMLIPRIVHQTYRTKQIPASLQAVMKSWTRVNGPAWQTRFYDDEACIEFVRREFPEYLDAYHALPKDVERSDFFRYMVVLRLGGVYADIDVELRQPLDRVVTPTDTLVVGWESEVSTDAEAFKRHFVRRRQVLQWFFAAAPGHPVLRAACDHINRNVHRTFSNNTNRDTLERTGPGMWTDAVSRHAAAHPPTLANDPWKVRILPRVAFGVHPAGIDGLTPDAKEIIVLHHFLGSWKKRGGWHKRRSVLQIVAGAVAGALRRHAQAAAAEEPITPSVLRLFPVSAAFTPPFTIMTHLVGQGDMQSGSDVSAVLTSWGTWQAALSRPSRRPLVVDALVGSLGPPEQGAVLVDVSAGPGFFSLAAAARGHSVVAFESSSRSIEAFSSSIKYNGFEKRIQLYNVSLGAAAATICLRERGSAASAAEAGGAGGSGAEPNDAAAAATRRGYGDPRLHALPASECESVTVRQTLAHMLLGSGSNIGGGASGSSRGAAVHNTESDAAMPGDAAIHGQAVNGQLAPVAARVGALRLSAHGWEGWVLDGAAPWMEQHRPGVVLLEYSPALVAKSGYPGGGTQLLNRLHELGYVHIAHAGYVCDERWFNISRAFRAGGGTVTEGGSVNAAGSVAGATAASTAAAELFGAGSTLPRQPTWCKLKPDLFQLLTDRAHPEVAENVLFIHHTHNSVRGEAQEGAGTLTSEARSAAVFPAASTGSDSAANIGDAHRNSRGTPPVTGGRLGSEPASMARAAMEGPSVVEAAMLRAAVAGNPGGALGDKVTQATSAGSAHDSATSTAALVEQAQTASLGRRGAAAA